jgi:anti-sigma regulatory factor (Ser/Thr protein kinase)
MQQATRARIRLRADQAAMGVVRRFIESFAGNAGIVGDDLSRILIVAEELVTNVVKYGYAGAVPGHLEVRLRLAGGRIALVLIDDGCAFDPFAAPPPDLEAPVEERRVGGLGLALVKGLMERRHYRRAGRHNVVVGSRAVASRSE